MLINWLTKRFFVKGWKKFFGTEPESSEDVLIDTIPAEIERIYGVTTNRNIWDRFVDSLNRLPRPLFTFGLFYLFVLGFINPERLHEYFIVLSQAPDMFWAVGLTIIGFWFGSKIIEKHGNKFDIEKWKTRMDAADRFSKLKEKNTTITNNTEAKGMKEVGQAQGPINKWSSLGPKDK